uniref:50S ribosomal protein L2 n=1 Tax=Streptomyces fradiae TaxID=1906 RepID=A0T1J4_STRFR|nr:unknown [Streptomyces fradiae]
MGIRKYKPTTPGRRGSSVADFVEVTRSTPEKSLVRPLHSKGGRNNAGRIKRPGDSDGPCRGGPEAGQWWPDYALGLARNAKEA